MSQDCGDGIYKLIGLTDFNQGPVRISDDSLEKYKINFF